MYTFQLITTSEKFGCVSFHVEGLVAVQRDMEGEHMKAFPTYHEAVEWILKKVSYMKRFAEDLTFIH